MLTIQKLNKQRSRTTTNAIKQKQTQKQKHNKSERATPIQHQRPHTCIGDHHFIFN